MDTDTDSLAVLADLIVNALESLMQKCPRCDSINLEPIFPIDIDDSGSVTTSVVVCVDCGNSFFVHRNSES